MKLYDFSQLDMSDLEKKRENKRPDKVKKILPKFLTKALTTSGPREGLMVAVFGLFLMVGLLISIYNKLHLIAGAQDMFIGLMVVVGLLFSAVIWRFSFWLEGDFGKHFNLYCVKNHETYVMSMLSLDVMALLIDEFYDWDIEVWKDRLYAYQKGEFSFSGRELPKIFDKLAKLQKEFIR